MRIPKSGSTTSSVQDKTLGTCSITGLTSGSYTVSEGTPPTGYTADADQTVTVTNDAASTATFTDNRTFKTVVIVCRESDKSLYPSAVTVGGTTAGTSAAAGDLTASATAEVCGLTAGARGGLTATVSTQAGNPYSAGVNIPHTQ